MIPAVFDIDGTLADTLPLVRECYEEAGAAGVTLEDVRKHWALWLPDLVGGRLNAEAIRHIKTNLYLSRLHEGVPALPAAALARELIDAGEPVYAVTAASDRTSRKVLEVVGLGDMWLLGNEVRPEGRSRLLNVLAPHGTYYDDDRPTCFLVQAETEWSAILV